MSLSFEFYDARAREAASEAEEATLANVKERHLRAERTWRGLAEQARRVAEDRAIADAKRTARRLADAEKERVASNRVDGSGLPIGRTRRNF